MRLQRNLLSAEEPDLWEPQKSYKLGAVVASEGRLYTCQTPHTSGETFSDSRTHWEDRGRIPHTLSSPGAASFFTTDRGRQAAAFALECARTALIKRARTFQFSLQLPLDLYSSLNPGESLSLADPRLPGGRVTGKITAVLIDITPQQAIPLLTITCAACPGCAVETTAVDTPPEVAYTEEAYAEPHYHTTKGSHETPSGLRFADYSSQVPEDFLANLGRGGGYELLKGMRLQNSPLEQEETLKQGARRTLGTTRIQLSFEKLHTRAARHHTLELQTLTPVALPQNVTLEET
jgi:hypothetical protein